MPKKERINQVLAELERTYRPTEKFQKAIKPLVDRLYNPETTDEDADKLLEQITGTYREYQRLELNSYAPWMM